MVLQDITEGGKPLYELGDHGKAWKTQEGFTGVGQAKLDSLKDSIKEIDELIDGRDELSKEIFKEGERIKMEITNFLAENVVKDPNDPIEAQERSALRQKKVDMAELQLNEKVACWKDVALLKREKRELERGVNEKEGRAEMLRGMLEA